MIRGQWNQIIFSPEYVIKPAIFVIQPSNAKMIWLHHATLPEESRVTPSPNKALTHAAGNL